MIEVVYTPKDNGKNNDVIRLPKNIKQIGEIKDSRKIYIEDYAINFIEEAHTQEEGSVVGVLLGMAQKSGMERYIFIKGAVLIPNVFVSESEISIAENDWAYIYEIAGKYFPSQEIVGWFMSMDGVNASILRTMKKTHANQFAGGDKVLFVFDRQENSKYFCIYENNQLVRQSGFTIYYERNEDMQEYMVDMRNGKRIEIETESENSVQSPAYRNMMNETPETDKKSGRKQAFVNYCANVAMVVLILFIGMYVIDGKKENNSINVGEEGVTTITPVVKVDGDVYPTTEQESEMESSGEQPQTEPESTVAETEKESTKETVNTANVTEAETTGSYMTVNTNVENTTAATEAVTEAAVTYKEHTVKKGESLLTICRKYYGDTSKVEEIMALNGIKDMDKIYIGQIIKLP